MFARYVARRYLFSPKSRSVINLIAALSAVAIAMPVAAMIILLSVFNGFETLIRSMGRTFDADLTVQPVQGHTFAPQTLDTAALARMPGVADFSYVLEQMALAEHDGRQLPVTVRGVDDRYAATLPQLPAAVESGEFRVRLGDLDRLVVGRALAGGLGIRSLADADVTLYGLRRGSFSTVLPIQNFRRRTVDVAGVYVLDQQTELRYALTSLRLAQELFSYPEHASALLVRVGENADPAAVKQSVAHWAGPGFRVRTRDEMQATFYAVMRYEKWGIFFISLLVLLIAAFSVVGALAMLITDKRRDIVTLRALGAPLPLVRAVFRTEGWLIAGIGAAGGAVLGVGLSLLQQHFGLIEIPAESFLTKSYPVAFRLADLGAVAVAFALVTAILTRVTVRSMIKNDKRPNDL